MNATYGPKPYPRPAARFWANFTGGAQVEIAIFGAKFENDTQVNWSLAPFKVPGDEHKAGAQTLGERIAKIGSYFEMHTLLAPNPTEFNGKVAERRDLTTSFDLAYGIELRRGAFADGIELLPREGMILSAGGCPLITASRKGRVIAAHAGLACLFDFDNPKRESVVDAITRVLGTQQHETDDPLEVRVDFAIPPHVYTHPFDDPIYGEKNRKLLNVLRERWGNKVLWGDNEAHGCIDLFELIKSQFKKVGRANIETGIYLPAGIAQSDETHILTYHTRQQKPYRDRRNLIVAMRTR